jgi:hypothetical protein
MFAAAAIYKVISRILHISKKTIVIFGNDYNQVYMQKYYLAYFGRTF